MSVLPAVISHPEAAHPGKVEKLVAYIKALDGTDVIVLPVTKTQDAEYCATRRSNVFFQLQAYTLRLEAEAMKDKAFIHLEPDSIPLKAGWAKMISDEYARLKKPYLWAWDQNPPADLCGGIGVYGPNTRNEIPCEMETGSWDGWMLDNIPGKIARTPLIQHSYGKYEGLHKVRDHKFPCDLKLLRRETVLFHRDPSQSLMRRGNYRFSHSGCIGDAIAALKTIQEFGGGHMVMTQHHNPRAIRGARYEYLKPLIAAQPYIKSVTWDEEAPDIDVDFTNFRTTYEPQHSLAWTQARYVGLDLKNVDPWLSAKPNKAGAGRIVVARSSRYHNEHFPWKQIGEKYGSKLLFVGVDDEYENFQNVLGVKIDRHICGNALETAEIIAGASLFIGNQSSSFWIAAGLGKRLVQETWNTMPDSMICREGCFYWRELSHTDAMMEFISVK